MNVSAIMNYLTKWIKVPRDERLINLISFQLIDDLFVIQLHIEVISLFLTKLRKLW